MKSTTHELQDLAPEHFSPEQFMRYALEVHPELHSLTSETLASPAAHQKPSQSKEDLARSLFPDLDDSRLVELNRSVNGLLSLEWVLKNDYESFTECQPQAGRLSRESFTTLRNYTMTFLETPEDIQAMKVFLAINDLGKVKAIADTVNTSLHIDEVDHDEILYLALTHFPEVSPGFSALPEKQQKYILDGLATQFNLGQFMQAENVPASLKKLGSVDEKTLHFYLIHTLYDIAGAAGHVTQKGSLVMNETSFQRFNGAIQSIDGLTKGKTETEVYNEYLQRISPLDIDLSKPADYMLARLCGMMYITNPWQAAALQETVKNLPDRTRGILETALNKTGIDDGMALLAYYSPAFLKNMSLSSDPKTFAATITAGLTALANTIQLARRHISRRKEDGVCTLFIHDIAQAAKHGDKGLKDMRMRVVKKGNDLEAIMEPSAEINVDKFERQSLADVPGENIAIIGIGGGSDVVQAGIFGKLLKDSDEKKKPIAISIRSQFTRSQDIDGNINLPRTIDNPGEQIAPGVFIVKPESTGSGRFVENVPAGDLTTILIIEQEGNLENQLQAITEKFGVDTVIALDTGGDALLPASDASSQDARSLVAISKLRNVRQLSCEIATGIDAPLNAEAVLLKAEATYFEPDQAQIDLVLRTYREWEFNGRRNDRYGKTALAWQQALRGKLGITEIPLPGHVIADDSNPWTPYVDIRRATRGIFIMDLAKHLKAIS